MREAKQYYYIDRKLISKEQTEVIEGLRQLQPFLSELTQTDILNSAVMRLMDLYSTSKFIYNRTTAADLLVSCGDKLANIPSKDQVVSILHKCLKAPDEFQRTLTTHTIERIAELFLRQNSVYHLFLSRLRAESERSPQEVFRIVCCLRKLLSLSEHLSTLFSNNLEELISLGGIPINYILYLACSAQFPSHEYPKIIDQVWKALQSNKLSKKNIYYMRRLLKRSISLNFTCFLIYKQYFSDLFSLPDPLASFQACLYYPFHPGVAIQSIAKFKNHELLDFLFISQQDGIRELRGQCEEVCLQRIQQSFSENSVSVQTILLTFYVQKSYDERLLNLNFPPTLKWIKLGLVTGNYRFAKNLIENVFKISTNNHSFLMVMIFYANLRIKPTRANLMNFLEVLQNLGKGEPAVVDLVKKWGQISPMDEEISDKQQTDQPKYQYFQEEFGYLKSGERFAPVRLQKCPFPSIYFSKQGIKDLFTLMR